MNPFQSWVGFKEIRRDGAIIREEKRSHHYKGKPLKRDWRDRLEVGDIIRHANGTERVVRGMSISTDGYLSCVYLSILRCSWTKRCYTVYTRSDLATIGYRPTKSVYQFPFAIDKKIRACLEETDGRQGRSLSCCDVEGVR